MLDLQRQLLQAQTLQIVAARDARIAVVDLAKAMGGGWDYKDAVSPLSGETRAPSRYCSDGRQRKLLRSADLMVIRSSWPLRDTSSGTSMPGAPERPHAAKEVGEAGRLRAGDLDDDVAELARPPRRPDRSPRAH